MYRDENGVSPFLDWLHQDSNTEIRIVVERYLDFLLAQRGTGIMGTKYLKPMGEHLFQLRIKEVDPCKGSRLLLRIYLCFDFNQGIHILSGYDKGLDDSRERQSSEIFKARQLLKKWMESNEPL